MVGTIIASLLFEQTTSAHNMFINHSTSHFFFFKIKVNVFGWMDNNCIGGFFKGTVFI